MTDDRLEFCTECGAKIKPEDEYCPACGNSLEYERNRNVDDYEWNKKHQRETPNYITLIAVMCALYFIFALYIGGSFTFNVDGLIDMMKDTTYWEQLMETVTEADVRSMLTAFGGVIIASGCLALVAGILTYLKRFNTAAIVSCALASIIGLVMLFGIVGLVFTYLIAKSKPLFID